MIKTSSNQETTENNKGPTNLNYKMQICLERGNIDEELKTGAEQLRGVSNTQQKALLSRLLVTSASLNSNKT